MSYLTQMAGLAVQNFVSAAVGMAVLAAVIRGFSNRSLKTLGNFWVDLYRSLVFILLPIAVVGAIVLVSQGVPDTFSGHAVVHTLQGATQDIARGPVASQIAIKQLGTNGGGFFNANSAAPFESPTSFTGYFELFLELLIPFALDLHVRQGHQRHAACLDDLLGSRRDLPDRHRHQRVRPSSTGPPCSATPA